MIVLIDGQTLGTPEMGRGIGEVFSRLLDGMVVSDISKRWVITLSDLSQLSKLRAQTAAALEPVVLPAIEMTSDRQANGRAYGERLQSIVNHLKPDWYWNPNPLMVNVVYPFSLQGVRRIVTLYDLIPAKLPELYLSQWDPDVAGDYRNRLASIAALSAEDMVLPISQATSQDFAELCPGAVCRVRAIPVASDFTQMYPLSCGMAMSVERFVLYVGGFDPRKNMTRAVHAFAKFRDKVPADDRDIRLKLVCAHTREQREAIEFLASSLGVGENVDVLGYISTDDLGRMFRCAALFFFPSLYEGFGLPALDALACGVPVVASRTSSLTEVCGTHAYYCDAEDIDSMAVELGNAWRARKERPGPWSNLATYARNNFSWQKCCDAYRDALSAEKASTAVVTKDMGHRFRVAYVSPWPPDPTGVSDYSYAVVNELKLMCDVTVYTGVSSPVPCSGVKILPIARYTDEAARYDQVIYHIGNGEAHVDIYEAAWRIPGLVVVHDFNIHPFMHAFMMRGGRSHLYRDALLWYGEAGKQAWDDFERASLIPETWDFGMTEPLVARSRAAIVHSRWVAKKYDGLAPIVACHLGAEVRPPASVTIRRDARSSLGLSEDILYVGAFGFVNNHKRIHVSMKAIAALRSEGLPVMLLIVGPVIDTTVNLDQLAAELHLESNAIRAIGRVSSVDLERYVNAVDVIVNLRFPTMGESSATLFNAFACSAATIVSDVNQFAELPDEITWKVDVVDTEEEVITAYLRHLLQSPTARLTLGKNAHSFVGRFAAIKQVAETYFRTAARFAAH